MRVASTQYHATMNAALQNASVRLEHVMQQMSSGLRNLLPSDDPVTNVRVSRLTREEAALDQYRANIGALRSRLQQNESLLDGMTQDLLNGRDLLVWAADGTNTSEDVAAMAQTLRSLRDSLFYSANRRDQEGRYLFSGTATDAPTVTLAAGVYSGNPNTNAQLVVVGNGMTQAANVTLGTEMEALLNRLSATITALEAPGANVNDPATHAIVVDGLQGIDDAINGLGSKIAALGGAQNLLETMESNHTSVSVSNKQAMITLGQLDYAEAAVQLNGYSAAVQATQKAYAKVSTLSLFDVL